MRRHPLRKMETHQMNKSAITALVIALMVFISGNNGHAEQIFVKFGTNLASDHPTSIALNYFRKAVNTSLPGQMNIQLFPDSQLGTADELLKGLQFGNIEMGVISSELLISYAPLLTTVTMPYIFKNEEHRFRVLDGPIGRQLLTSLEKENLIGLGFLNSTAKSIITKQHCIKKPGDFQGMNIGLLPPCIGQECQDDTIQLYSRGFTAMGATVESIPQENIYEILQTDTISGLEIDPATALMLKIYETDASYVTFDKHIAIPDVIVASKRWFDGLSPEMQQTLQKASRTTVLKQRQLWKAAVQEIIAKLEAEGMTFESIEREEFYEATQSVYEDMYKQFGPDFEHIVQSISTVH